LLIQLRDIHARLRETIAELGDVLTEPTVDFVALAKTRMKLTRTTGHWRTLMQCKILPELSNVTPDERRQLAELRREEADFAVRKSAHIARWSARATEADIAGYRGASADMRQSLLARIDREAAILYPLLKEKIAERAATPAGVSGNAGPQSAPPAW